MFLASLSPMRENVVHDAVACDEGPNMFCSKCGRRNPENARYCRVCGVPREETGRPTAIRVGRGEAELDNTRRGSGGDSVLQIAPGEMSGSAPAARDRRVTYQTRANGHSKVESAEDREDFGEPLETFVLDDPLEASQRSAWGGGLIGVIVFVFLGIWALVVIAEFFE